jgi:hypothetical protein
MKTFELNRWLGHQAWAIHDRNQPSAFESENLGAGLLYCPQSMSLALQKSWDVVISVNHFIIRSKDFTMASWSWILDLIADEMLLYGTIGQTSLGRLVIGQFAK